MDLVIISNFFVVVVLKEKIFFLKKKTTKDCQFTLNLACLKSSKKSPLTSAQLQFSLFSWSSNIPHIS